MDKTVDIEVGVVNGRELLNTHKFRPNPSFYVSLRLNDDGKRTHGGGQGSKAPKWDQNFVFAANLSTTIHVEVYCIHGHTREDHLIGQADVELFSFERNQDIEITLHNQSKKTNETVISGYITLHLKVALPVSFIKVQESKADLRSLHYMRQMEKLVGQVSQEEMNQLSPSWILLAGNLDMVSSLAEKISDLDSRATMAVNAVAFMLQVLIKQIERDEKVEQLGTIMADLYSYVRDGVEMDKILTYQKTLDKLLTQTSECAYFIAEYRKVKAFAKRAVINLNSDADSMITQFEGAFGELKIELILGSTLQTAVVSFRILQTVENIESLMHVNNLSYLRNIGWDSGRTCLRGTRQSVIDDILRWASSSSGDVTEIAKKRIYVLAGPAGCGKSAIAHTIAQAFHQQQRLGASVFLDAGTNANSHTVSSSIVFQLAGYNSAIKTRVAEKIRMDTTLASADIGQQFPHLLVEAINTGVTKADTTLVMVGPTLIVIDGLHEMADKREQNRILTAVADYLVQLPPNFRVLLTSRDGDIVTGIFRRISQRCHIQKITFENSRGEHPSDYMTSCLTELFVDVPKLVDHFTLEELNGQLVDRSMGLHLWIDTFQRFLNFCMKQKNDKELSVLQKIIENPVPLSKEDAMDDLYRIICNSIAYPAHFFKDILFTFIHSTIPLSFTSAHLPISLACTFDTDDGSACGIFEMMKQLGLLVEKGENEENVVCFSLHPSFEDFLINERRSHETEYFVARGTSRQVLQVAAERVNVINELLRDDLAKLQVLRSPSPDQISSTVAANLHYACCTWVYCVDLCGTESLICQPEYMELFKSLETFISEHLFQWMEYMGFNGFEAHTAAFLQRLFGWSENHLVQSNGTFKILQSILNMDVNQTNQKQVQYSYWSKIEDSTMPNKAYRAISLNKDGATPYFSSVENTLPEELGNNAEIASAGDLSKVVYTTSFDWTATSRTNQCFIITPKLPVWIGSKEASDIKQVSFKLTSIYDRNVHMPFITAYPPYEQSYGWFDAAIIRDFRVDVTPEEGEFETHAKAYVKDAIKEHGDADTKLLQVVTVRNPHRKADDDGVWSGQPHRQLFSDPSSLADRSDTVEEYVSDTYRSYDVWYIQNHTRIFDDSKVYQVTWTDSQQEDHSDDEKSSTGFGKGTGFVQLLKPGDRIAVISRNRGRGWMQHMQKMEIEVIYAA